MESVRKAYVSIMGLEEGQLLGRVIFDEPMHLSEYGATYVVQYEITLKDDGMFDFKMIPLYVQLSLLEGEDIWV